MSRLDRARAFLQQESPDAVKLRVSQRNLRETKHELDQALDREERLKKQLEALIDLSVAEDDEFEPFTISPKHATDDEAIAVAVASDWHIEEKVEKSKVTGRNEYNPDIARFRAQNFFEGVRWLLEQHSQGESSYKIDTLVLAVIGDLISGYIHEDLRRSNYLPPNKASLMAHELLKNGIDYLLEKTELQQIVVPCCFGNHGRLNHKPLVSQACEDSLEWLVFKVTENVYKDNPRVKFIVPSGAFVYVNIYGMVVRFHHGDYVRYGGGVGGVTIPLRKAIDRWNEERHADLTVIGHWHQMLDGTDYLINGSLIGYNAYCRKIKAPYEPPRQSFFLIDKKRGKRAVSPVYVDDNYLWSWSDTTWNNKVGLVG